MLREEKQREGPRRASKATSVPGDHKLVSKSQPNLQHTSYCESLRNSGGPNSSRCFRNGRVCDVHQRSYLNKDAFRSLRYFLYRVLVKRQLFPGSASFFVNAATVASRW